MLLPRATTSSFDAMRKRVGADTRSASARWPQLVRRAAAAAVTIAVFLFLCVQYEMLAGSVATIAVHPAQAQHPLADAEAAEPTSSESLDAVAAIEALARDDAAMNLRGAETEDNETADRNDGEPAAPAANDAINAEKELASATPEPTTTAPKTPKPSPTLDEQEQRRLAVKRAMQHAWGSYEAHAFGADEIDPISGKPRNDVWGGIACTLVDALDTLWIMDMKAEFDRAREYVAHRLRFGHLGADGNRISIFETIIREVGGLLSAFDLSGDEVFVHKAREIMDLMLPAFNASQGIFHTFLNPMTKESGFAPWAGSRAHIADIGTLQLETRYLSDVTGDPKYAAMGEAFYDILQREGSYMQTGLFPVHFDVAAGQFANYSTITLGALGDSFYEYLLKVFIYSGKRDKDQFLRKLYDDAVQGMQQHLLYYSAMDDLFFLQEIETPGFYGNQKMDHLLCFVPGMLALGTLHEKEDDAKNARHLSLANKLMETCYQMYHQQPTGLSPDVVGFPGMFAQDLQYRLRPETIESLFYMYRITKDEKYREFGWEIFQSLEKHAKAPFGYGAVYNVSKVPAELDNKMESFFLAETLKYHYLLQAPEDLIPLDEYVFNTEAHPLRIRAVAK